MTPSHPASESRKRLKTTLSNPGNLGGPAVGTEWPSGDSPRSNSMKRVVGYFRQLEWPDRFNLVLATILGAVLVLVLSPVLLALWMYLQVANRARAAGRDRTKP